MNCIYALDITSYIEEVVVATSAHLVIYIYFHATLDARYAIYVLTIKLGRIVIYPLNL